MKKKGVLWSNDVLTQFEEILQYIRRDSPEQANKFGEKIIKAIDRLTVFPESGRIVPELHDRIPPPREIFVGEYRIIYRIIGNNIDLMVFSHGKRLLTFFLGMPS